MYFEQDILSDDYLDDAPPEYKCPITLSIMKHPYIMPDGQTYEYDAIQTALNIKPYSPVTRQPMKMSQGITNYALKNLIEKYIQEKLNGKKTIKMNHMKNREMINDNEKSSKFIYSNYLIYHFTKSLIQSLHCGLSYLFDLIGCMILFIFDILEDVMSKLFTALKIFIVGVGYGIAMLFYCLFDFLIIPLVYVIFSPFLFVGYIVEFLFLMIIEIIGILFDIIFD